MATMNKLFRHAVYPVDWIIMGYCALMTGLLLLFGRPLGEYADELLFYVGVLALVLLIVRIFGEKQSTVARFVRLLYPAIFFTAFYRMTGGMMFLLHDRFMDSRLSGFEQAILGFEPSQYIDRFLPNLWITEILMGSYFSYYLMLPALLIPLFIWKKDAMIRQSLAAISLTFFVGYMLFFLYPVEGPRWHYADQYIHAVEGPFFRQIVELVQAKGSVRGGCVPSTHVAVAIIVMVYFFKIAKPLGWVTALLNLGMALGTVWGRYHYVTDVVVGSIIAVVALWIVNRFWPSSEEVSADAVKNIPIKVHNVS